MNYFSMFTGIGGFELGIQKAKENNKSQSEKWRFKERRNRDIGIGRTRFHNRQNTTLRNGWECIGYSEINKYAIKVFEKRFPKIRNYGDCKTINPNELPDFDLLLGGFPCQSFSIAGKRRGFTDTRGTLFFDICRIIKVKRPQFLLLENVKGLLSHDEGKTFGTILSCLEELGYYVEWQVLNSKYFGVPQNRERVFIIGYIRGTTRPKILPITNDDQYNNEEDKGESRFQTNISGTITTRFGDRYQDTFIKTIYRPRFDDGDGFEMNNRIYGTDGISPTLQAGDSGEIKISPCLTQVRRLTPVECERLQGFPDDWTKGLSDTQRYKCLGNAVTVNVIQVIISKWMVESN